MSLPRILHVYKTAHPEQRGGIVEIIRSIADGLSGTFEATLLVASNHPARFFKREWGANVVRAPHFGTFMSMPIAPTLPLQLVMMASRYDLVALHAPFPLADLAGLLGAFSRSRLIVHWHSDIIRQTMFRPLYRTPMRHTLQRAKRIIVSGQAVIDASAFLPPLAGKCAVVPFGTEIDYWDRISNADRLAVASMQIAEPRLVLAVGRLVSYKGFHILIEAMRDVDGTLAIVGEGPLRAVLEDLASRAGVTAKVRFLGDVSKEELRRLYHAARMLAFPSITAAETFGLVQVEAMACSLPVVNTFLSTSVPDISRHGIEGLTVPPSDAPSLAGALSELLGDGRKRDRFAAAARRRAGEFFSSKTFLEGIRREYHLALDD